MHRPWRYRSGLMPMRVSSSHAGGPNMPVWHGPRHNLRPAVSTAKWPSSSAKCPIQQNGCRRTSDGRNYRAASTGSRSCRQIKRHPRLSYIHTGTFGGFTCQEPDALKSEISKFQCLKILVTALDSIKNHLVLANVIMPRLAYNTKFAACYRRPLL
jgi:hypothetical protein